MRIGRDSGASAWLAILAAVLLTFTLTGCGDGGQGAPQNTVDVEDMTEDERYFGGDEFVGERVTFVAQVSEIVSPTSVVVNSEDRGDASVLVVSANLVKEVDTGDLVEVGGTVRQFAYGDYFQDFDLGDAEQYRRYENEEFVVVTGARKLTGEATIGTAAR